MLRTPTDNLIYKKDMRYDERLNFCCGPEIRAS
jgi:hypothetical protein